MRYLLIPITMVLWFIITYAFLFIVSRGVLAIFLLNWLWIMLIGSFIGLAIAYSLKGIEFLIDKFILGFYRYNWVTIILHSIVALVVSIGFILHYIFEPYPMMNGEEGTELLFIQMWEGDLIGTLIFIPVLIGAILYISWIIVVSPIQLKMEEVRFNRYESDYQRKEETAKEYDIQVPIIREKDIENEFSKILDQPKEIEWNLSIILDQIERIERELDEQRLMSMPSHIIINRMEVELLHTIAKRDFLEKKLEQFIPEEPYDDESGEY